MQAARNVGLPDAERDIEVVLAIVLTVRRLQLDHQLARICLHRDASGEGQTDQGTKQGTFLATTKPQPMHVAPTVQVTASRNAWYL
jgi:hypothetical protein